MTLHSSPSGSVPSFTLPYHSSGTRNVQTPSTKLSRHIPQPLKTIHQKPTPQLNNLKKPTKNKPRPTQGRPTTYRNNLQKVAWKVLHSSTFPSPSHPPPPNTASARGRGHVSDAPSRPENIHGPGYRWCLAQLANMIFWVGRDVKNELELIYLSKSEFYIYIYKVYIKVYIPPKLR